MKILFSINGKFGLSKFVLDKLGINSIDELNNNFFGIISKNKFAWRTSEKLISIIEKIGIKNSSIENSELRIKDWNIKDFGLWILTINDDYEWPAILIGTNYDDYENKNYIIGNYKGD